MPVIADKKKSTPSEAEPFQPIDQRLREHYQTLTPREKKLADFILQHPQDLALFNTTELARICDVSKATVSRLFRRLGFSSFREGREMARSLRQQGVPLLEEGSEAIPFESQLMQEQQNLQRLFQSLQPELIEQICSSLSEARRVLVVGYRNSYPVALHLRQQLIQVRDQVQIAPQPGQSLGEELVGLTGKDLVVVIGFRRRSKGFAKLMEWLQHSETPLLLISDHTAIRYADHADWWIDCPLDTQGAFDSYSSAMSLVTLLVNHLLYRNLESGKTRIAAISHQYEELDELVLLP